MSHTVIILLNCVISYFHFLNSIIVCAKQRHYVSEGGVDHFYNFCCQVKNAIVLSEEKKKKYLHFLPADPFFIPAICPYGLLLIIPNNKLGLKRTSR